ncbi:MAG: response regulator [Chloroflexota bacterium]
MNAKMSVDFLNGMKIVIIDDDADSLDVAKILLEFSGADVRTANNGQEGLEVIQTFDPFLVLSDISMPKLDGWGLIKELRKSQRIATLVVIALTAHAMVGDREKVMQAGFDGYLAKPLQPTTFISDLLKAIDTTRHIYTTKKIQKVQE